VTFVTPEAVADQMRAPEAGAGTTCLHHDALPIADVHRGLDEDDLSLNHHPALTSCLSMIFFRKPVSTFRDHALVPVYEPDSPSGAGGLYKTPDYNSVR
jgi:hypothetical protein